MHRAATASLGVDVSSSGYFQHGTFVAGTLVLGVIPSSPAQQAGIVPGDVITAIGGQSVISPTMLTGVLLSSTPGAKQKICWVDGYGDTHHATVTFASGPPQ